MKTQAKEIAYRVNPRISVVANLAFGLAVLIFCVAAQAGKITSVPSVDGAEGFAGWNFDNVDIVVDGTQGEIGGAGSWFDYDFGAYQFAEDSDFTFTGEVFDSIDPEQDTLMGIVLGKDWPVGEPSGIKVVNDDMAVKNGKPTNCIMTTSYLEGHYLDSDDPQQVMCSSGFQTHKRYKVAMLPSSVDGVGSEAIDLVFNVEAEAGSRDYQVFQKINNWTDTRLVGFTVQVGFGIAGDFQTPADAGVNLADLHLSVPSEIWDAGQLANFSAGLFGPLDKHTGNIGFFDPNQRAGFLIDEYGVGEQPLTAILHATRTLGSDYQEVPPGAAVANQFGAWLPDNMLPYGIFFDDDGNPETDASLLGWYGYNPSAGALGWMRGVEHADGPFAAISDADIETMGMNLSYTMGEIDDLVNVGLNYIVTVGDVSTFPGNTFTLRVTPTPDTSGAPAPRYVGAEPHPGLVFGSSNAAVLLEPEGTFAVGGVLTARVGDQDLNKDPEVAEVIEVSISHSSQDWQEPLELIEQGENRGVFVATLPEAYSNVSAGNWVTLRYLDADDGSGAEVLKASSSQAVYVPPVIESDVYIDEFTVPDAVLDGQSRALRVAVVNAQDAVGPASGVVRISGSDGSEFVQEFTNLEPGSKYKFSIKWVADLLDSQVAETVSWLATVEIGGAVTDQATASSVIDIKVRKNAKN